jgi:transposase-like protein
VYLSRAVDEAGPPASVRLSDRRDVSAAKALFNKAIRHQGHARHEVGFAAYTGSHLAVREMQKADKLSQKHETAVFEVSEQSA